MSHITATQYNSFISLEDYEEYLKTTLDYMLHTTAGLGLRIDKLIFQRITKALNKKNATCVIQGDIKPVLTTILVKIMLLYTIKYDAMSPLLPPDLLTPQLYISRRPNNDTVLIIKDLVCILSEFMKNASCPLDPVIIKALDLRKHLAKSKLSAWKASFIIRLIPWMHILIKQTSIKKWLKIKLGKIITKLVLKTQGIKDFDVSKLINKLFENKAFLDSFISVIIEINQVKTKPKTTLSNNIQIPICQWTTYILEALDKNTWVSINNVITNTFILLANEKNVVQHNTVKSTKNKSAFPMSIIMQLNHCLALHAASKISRAQGNIYMNALKAAISFEIDASCPMRKIAEEEDEDDMLLDIAEEARAMIARGSIRFA